MRLRRRWFTPNLPMSCIFCPANCRSYFSLWVSGLYRWQKLGLGNREIRAGGHETQRRETNKRRKKNASAIKKIKNKKNRIKNKKEFRCSFIFFFFSLFPFYKKFFEKNLKTKKKEIRTTYNTSFEKLVIYQYWFIAYYQVAHSSTSFLVVLYIIDTSYL